MSAIYYLRSIENKHDVCRGIDSRKTFCESLGDHTRKIINFKNKKMKLLTKDQQESYKNTKICYVCKKNPKNKYLKKINYRKIEDHCHYAGVYRDTEHSVPKEIHIVFHDGWNYDFDFIIKS